MKPDLRPTHLTHRVYDHLKDMIRGGDFSTVEPMFETQLAAQLGVSRTPVREALRMLEIEGYLESVASGGMRAYPLKSRDLMDVLEARIALEQVTVRIAAQRVDAHGMALIDDVLEKTERAIAEGMLADILAQNERFHRVIAAVTGTRFLEQMVDRIYDFVKTHRLNRTFGRVLGLQLTIKTVFDEHRQIAEAIRAKDPELAASLMQDHLRDVGERYAKGLEKLMEPELTGTTGG